MTEKMKERVVALMEERGVTIDQIAEIVYTLQIPYCFELHLAECLESVERVLDKREVQHTVLTGISLDLMAERDLLPEPLLQIIKEDEPLYGVDESLAMAIAHIYGTIGYTSFGYLDKNKFGIISKLDNNKEKVNTFLDDIVAGIASAASARIAHTREEDCS
ncbi:MAG: phosphatidylglycerophosphatase A [Halanaerobium sp.]|nr:phosphatidylglycerophosphatase A [Halanaerobium sp.]